MVVWYQHFNIVTTIVREKWLLEPWARFVFIFLPWVWNNYMPDGTGYTVRSVRFYFSPLTVEELLAGWVGLNWISSLPPCRFLFLFSLAAFPRMNRESVQWERFLPEIFGWLLNGNVAGCFSPLAGLGWLLTGGRFVVGWFLPHFVDANISGINLITVRDIYVGEMVEPKKKIFFLEAWWFDEPTLWWLSVYFRELRLVVANLTLVSLKFD